jgi:hypothetical protein
VASDNSGTSSSGLGHIIVGERLDGERFVDRRLLIFDDSENGEDLFESVVDKKESREEDEEVGDEDEGRPVRELTDLMAQVWRRHVIAPHKQRTSVGKHGKWRMRKKAKYEEVV